MRTNGVRCLGIASVVTALLIMPTVFGSPAPEFILKLEDNLFFPSRLEVPANTKIKLIIINLDATPEEFDSFDLNREKVIFPHRQAVIYVGPLKPGEYTFFGEYNPNTARGLLVAIEVPGGSPDAD